MPTPEDIANQRALLDTYRRRLATQLRQLAAIGQLYAQPAIFEDIRNARSEIARIKEVLHAWGVAVEAQPDDIDPTEVVSAPPRRLRVFISYHDVTPDESLARALAAALCDGYDVFIDQGLSVGTRGVEQIQVELARADALIMLLSERAVESAMLREEVVWVQELDSKPLILPVRLAYRNPFPYPLSAYLDDRQWAFWAGNEDTPALIATLRRALSGGGLPLQSEGEKAGVLQFTDSNSSILSIPPAMAQPPLRSRSTPLEQPEGTMPVTSRFYISRPADRPAIDSIGELGVTITIKGPRQVGKSSLLMRVIDAAAGKRVAFLDFQLFDRLALANADRFFRQFCAWLTRRLKLEDRLAEYWSMELGNSQTCTSYMGDYLLQELGEPLVLAMDEVESLFEADFRSDFFGMLRSWHNSRAFDPIWKQLDIVLVTSTEPYQLIKNLNQSPFNVGQVITLDDFTTAEAHELNERHNHPLAPVNANRLNNLLSGHPYLTRRALYLLASGRSSTDELFTQAAAERGPFGDHLRYHLFRMNSQPELVSGLLQVLQHSRCSDETVFWRLYGAGLVRGEFQSARPRNLLYADFFSKHLKRG